MADIVLGIGASHTTLMNTQWGAVDHLERAHRFRNALHEAAAALKQAAPDAVVIVGSNHFRGFWLDLMPAFTIGVGEVISSGEHGTPAGQLSSHGPLGQQLCNALLQREFDVAFSARLTVDHGISHAVQWIVKNSGAPIVPLVVNCFAPPLPSLRRTRALGEALAEALEAATTCQRIAVIATGGLSHQLPFPDWRAPVSEDDEYLVESWRLGRGRWQEYEQRRRSIVVQAPPRINEAFDQAFLELLASGRLQEFPSLYSNEELTGMAGNGAAELRAWQIMAAALGYRPGRLLGYSPMPEWLTGMAVALIDGEAHDTDQEST
jgi:2,3-dihydroxyphenylpropionate 1,2-dioxygenase